MASEFEMYHGYTVCFYVEAIADHPSADFGAFTRLWLNASHGAMVGYITPDRAHCEGVPRLWLGDAVAARADANQQFEVRAVVPETHSAESLLNAIADELEPHGWGIAQYKRGAIWKQSEARTKARVEHIGKLASNLGKPLY